MNDNITEINKDSFWKLIQSAKETCGQDMDAIPTERASEKCLCRHPTPER